MDELEQEPERCECATGCMVVVNNAQGVATWCIWCGIGWGEPSLMVLHAGQPMEGATIAAVSIPIFPGAKLSSY